MNKVHSRASVCTAPSPIHVPSRPFLGNESVTSWHPVFSLTPVIGKKYILYCCHSNECQELNEKRCFSRARRTRLGRVSNRPMGRTTRRDEWLCATWHVTRSMSRKRFECTVWDEIINTGDILMVTIATIYRTRWMFTKQPNCRRK